MRNSIVLILILFSHLINAQKCITPNIVVERPTHFATEKTNFPICIQVVFHLILPAHVLNTIPDYALLNLIERTNQDFSKNNTEVQQVPSTEQSLIGNDQIKFAIAGIQRKETTEHEFGLTDHIYYNQSGGSDSWDTDKFLNIWIVELTENITGFSSSPWSNSGEKDGVVISPSSVVPQYASNFSYRTLTHEVGHFLGLLHIWGNFSDECEEDDGIHDTPPQSSPHYQCAKFKNYSCEEDTQAISWNFMDYSPDCCMAGFTNDQIAWMRDVLLHERLSLKISGDDYVDSIYTRLTHDRELLIFPIPADSHITLDWSEHIKNGGGNMRHLEIIGVNGLKYGYYNVTGEFNSLIMCINHIPDGLFYIVGEDEEGQKLGPKLFQHLSK